MKKTRNIRKAVGALKTKKKAKKAGGGGAALATEEVAGKLAVPDIQDELENAAQALKVKEEKPASRGCGCGW